MKYLIFDNEIKAKERSAAMFKSKGTTKYLLNWRVHPKSPITALVVPDGYENHLTIREVADLLDSLDSTWEADSGMV